MTQFELRHNFRNTVCNMSQPTEPQWWPTQHGFFRGGKLWVKSWQLFPCLWNRQTLHQRHHFVFETDDSRTLISMITFWCSFYPPRYVCERDWDGDRSTERECVSVCLCVISMCPLTARRYHLGLKSPPSCCWGSWLATIINLRQVAENSEWHANLSWCPSGAAMLTAGENEAMLLQTLSLFLSWA